jgi:hypothetical protein
MNPWFERPKGKGMRTGITEDVEEERDDDDDDEY